MDNSYNNITILNVVSMDDMKKVFNIINHWTKMKLLGFVPFFIFYRANEKGDLWMLKNTETGDILGTSYVIQRKRPSCFFQLKTFAIHPDWTNKGLGRFFLESIMDKLTTTNTHLPWRLEVKSTNNHAIRLYTGVGFSVVEGEKILPNGDVVITMERI